MKRPELIVLAILIVVSLVVWAVWAHHWQAQVTQKEEMQTLYAFASGGDLDSVKRLSQYASSEAILWLEKLARQPDATADSRVAAIKALGGKPSLNWTVLPPLLYIDQPFVVRHAAAEVLEQRGCEDRCISATLYGLHAIWKGQPAIEAAPSTKQLERHYGVHGNPELEAKIDAELRAKTEQDYWKLLKIDDCATHRLLNTEYSSEPRFIDSIHTKLKPC